MARIPLLALLVCLTLAGCTGGNASPSGGEEAGPDVTPGADVVEAIELRGHVFTPAFVPIANATVTVIATELREVTREDGAFDFGRHEARIYTLLATATGFMESSLTVTPDQAGQAIRLVMQPGLPTQPYNHTFGFTGIMQCAFEAVIISPSCDSVIAAANDEIDDRGGGRPLPLLFDTNQSFVFLAEPGWSTLVIDVVFDGEAHPGLDGLRITVRGSLDPDSGGDYTQYGRWNDAQSFTARLEPGESYDEGTEPVPQNATGFQVDTYPHSHLWHAGEASPFLGVGFGQNVRFDLYATLFYVEPAPEDFTLRSA